MDQKSRRDFLRTTAAFSSALIPSATLASSFASSFAVDSNKFLEAVRSGNLDSVKALLQVDGSLLNSKDESGLSSYGMALLNGHREVAQFLKQFGYQSDLHESALAADWERFDQLVNKREPEEISKLINSNHPVGGTGMYAAAAGGAGSDMWRIYALCGKPNVIPKGKNGISPLQKALRYPDLRVAEITAAALLSNDANPNPGPNAEQSPLQIAAARGSSEMVEMLVRLGADVDAKDNEGKTARQLAETNGHESVAKLLHSHSEIPRVCRTSRTAFDIEGRAYKVPDIQDIPLVERRKFVGESHFNLEYVATELAKNPRLVHSAATTSEICVEACAHIGRKPIVEILLKNGSPYSLPTAVMMNDMKTVTQYLDQDPNRIHERGAHDYPLLWYPVIGKCPVEMMELLLARGAKVEQQHFLGTTALHWAARLGNLQCVELLIEHGADVNRGGRKFKAEPETPLMQSRDETSRDETITKVLKAHGAK